MSIETHTAWLLDFYAHPQVGVRLWFLFEDGSRRCFELAFPVKDQHPSLTAASPDFHFAASVACFGMMLRGSEHKGDSEYGLAIELAQTGKGSDPQGYRSEYIQIVKTAQALAGK